jgi:hypothetical protein
LPLVTGITLPGLLLGLLPAATLVTLAVGLLDLPCSWSGPLNRRGALVASASMVTAWAAVGALVLSLFHALTATFVEAWWMIGFAAAACWTACRYQSGRLAFRSLRYPRLASDEVAALTVLVCILAAAFLMAVLSPPNNADSLNYHLPRQLFWISQRSVFLSSAPYFAMLTQPPLAEYLGVNLMLLSDSDRLNNLLQFVAFVLVLVLLSLLLRALGYGRRPQLFAAVYFATLPAAFFQASNTKNDLLLSCFLLASLWVTAGLPRHRRLKLDAAGALGFFAGAALLTKGTAVVYLTVIGVSVLAACLAKQVRISVGSGLLALAFTAVLPAVHYLPQGSAILHAESGSGSHHVNARFDPLSTSSVLVRNLGTQFGTPITAVNTAISGLVAGFHRTIGRELNDPSTTFAFGGPFQVRYEPTHEDFPPAFVHFLLIGLLPVFGFAMRKQAVVRRDVLIFAGLALALLVGFSAVFRWQPWHARLLIPVVAVAAVSVGIAAAFAGHVLWRLLLLAALAAWWSPSVGLFQRPLIGPGSVFRASESALLIGKLPADNDIIDSLAKIFARITPCRMVVDTGSAFVYPALRALLLRPDRDTVLLGPSELDRNQPDAVLAYRPAPKPAAADQSPEAAPSAGLQRVLDHEGWSLQLSPKLTREVSDAALFPVFYGFREATGLGPVQGPLPQFGLPIFRNAWMPSASVVVDGSPTPRVLRLGLIPYDGPQSVRVAIDEDILRRIELPVDGRSGTLIPLGVRPEPFRVMLAFDRGYASGWDPAPVALRITRLQILPADFPDSAAGAAASESVGGGP